MSPRSAGIDTLLEVDTVVQYSCSNLVLILCNGIKLFGGEKILLQVGLLSLCFKFDTECLTSCTCKITYQM